MQTSTLIVIIMCERDECLLMFVTPCARCVVASIRTCMICLACSIRRDVMFTTSVSPDSVSRIVTCRPNTNPIVITHTSTATGASLQMLLQGTGTMAIEEAKGMMAAEEAKGTMAIEEAAGHKHNGDRGGKRNYNRQNLTAPTTGCLGPIRAKATAGWASDGV